MWPVEYNAYGPANTRVILRPNGAKDYAIADHLGSVRLLLGDDGVIKEQRSYGPFGEDLISDGDGARTSYIGRENDHESNLGFFGVRHYDPTYGRFMSVDPLWAKYAPLQPYHYAGNEPVGRLDWDGREVVFKNQTEMRLYNEAKDYIVTHAPEAAEYFNAVESSEDILVLHINGNEVNEARDPGNWADEHWAGDKAKETTSDGRKKDVYGVDWDPGAAQLLGDMGSQSPAMSLFHEILHIAGYIQRKAQSNAKDDERTSNPEERRVIRIENKIAEKLGEAVRDCHKCGFKPVYIRVKSVTSGGSQGVKRPIQAQTVDKTPHEEK